MQKMVAGNVLEVVGQAHPVMEEIVVQKVYRISAIFTRGLNKIHQFQIRVEFKGGLILRFFLFSVYLRVKL